MYAGKNMGIMTTLKKTYCRKAPPWEIAFVSDRLAAAASVRAAHPAACASGAGGDRWGSLTYLTSLSCRCHGLQPEAFDRATLPTRVETGFVFLHLPEVLTGFRGVAAGAIIPIHPGAPWAPARRPVTSQKSNAASHWGHRATAAAYRWAAST